MNKTLIIGGCGYIGSRLFNYLKQKQYEVVSLDLELFGNPNVQNTKENYKDLTKEDIARFDNVILLAGHSSVKMCESNMIGCFRNNVQYFVELLSKISKNQKFIYASSSSVYGNVNRNIVTEECQEYVAGSFYDLSKAEIDHYVKIFDEVNYYGLRFGTVNGFSPNTRNDVMINAMVSSAIANKEVKVFNPMIRRPILYINDLCRAVETIIIEGNHSNRGLYNLASFNSTADIIGRKTSEVFDDIKLSVIDREPTPEENINKKLNSKVYDFAISSDKFISTFNFKFEGTIKDIAIELKENLNKAFLLDGRNKGSIIV
jgi:nucleoside-diphosphate-sugar epimerase